MGESLDPNSLQGKVAEIRKALEKAKADCFYNPKDPEVIRLTKAYKEAALQAEAEENGKAAEAQLEAKSAAGGSTAAPSRVAGNNNTTKAASNQTEPQSPAAQAEALKGAFPKPEEPGSVKVAKAEAQLQAAKDKGNKKLVKQLKSKVEARKKKAEERSPAPPPATQSAQEIAVSLDT